MLTRLVLGLVHRCRRAWRRTFGRPTRVNTPSGEGTSGRSTSQARFWGEFREGQREAAERAERGERGR
jgi:hypothetical protein